MTYLMIPRYRYQVYVFLFIRKREVKGKYQRGTLSPFEGFPHKPTEGTMIASWGDKLRKDHPVNQPHPAIAMDPSLL